MPNTEPTNIPQVPPEAPQLPAVPPKTAVAVNSVPDRSPTAKRQFALQIEGEGKVEWRNIGISMREEFVIERYLDGEAFPVIAKAFEVRFRKPVTRAAFVKWLARPWVKAYLNLRLKAKGMYNRYAGVGGKELWLSELMEMKEGLAGYTEGKGSRNYFNKIHMHEMIGEFMGFKVESKQGPRSVTNMQINFTDRNGQ